MNQGLYDRCSRLLARIIGRLDNELCHRRLRRRDPLIPPRRLTPRYALGHGWALGEVVVDQITARCGLTPHERVLEIGCGVGRLALPLARHLDDEALYHGLDIVPEWIGWCQRISARHSNFRFTLADIYNGQYNPAGSQRADEYTFPFPDHSFDLVILASVFTHMLPDDIERYVAEVSRVLANGGRCFATFFLIDEAWSERLARGEVESPFHAFTREEAGYFVLPARRRHEWAVAYPEEDIRALFQRHGLQVSEPLVRGRWSWPSSNSGIGQDAVIAGST